MLFNFIAFQIPGSSLKEKISLQYRQLAVLLAANIPTVEALEILIEKCGSKKILKILDSLRKAVSSEATDVHIPTAYSKYFNHALVFILKQEKHSEKVASFLHDIADELENSSDFTKRALNAMTYPFILLIIATIITSILLVFVIPVFTEMFSSFGNNLPAPTQAILSISEILRNNLLFFIAGFLIILMTGIKLKRFFLVIATYIPIIRKPFKNLSLLQFTKYLSIMLKIKIPMQEAIHYSAFAVDNYIYANKIRKMGISLDNNLTLSEAMKKTDIFPDILTQVADIGEKSQSLDNILIHISRYFEKQVDSSLYNLTTIYNSLSIIVVGLIVGYIVYAMYLPIFTLAGTVL